MSGWPMVGYEVKIIDPTSGAEQPPDTIGEICVRGDALMQGLHKLERADTFDEVFLEGTAPTEIAPAAGQEQSADELLLGQ
jgi:acyl-CoA synthetase (AMP-forming)/AMP-acid ligase II